MPWTCKCGLINASINKLCAGLNQPVLDDLQHFQISPSTYDITLYWTRERRIKELTANEDKFAQFFNAEAVFVSSMSAIELEEHIQELEEIAFEAKARLTAAKTNKRDRDAKRFVGGDWSITPTNPDPNVTDTINKVKLRGQRMTKLDKMRDKLAALGIEDKEIEQMIAAMVKQARKDKPDSPKDKKDSNETDNGDASTAVAKPSNPIKPISPIAAKPIEQGKPLDLSTLKFK